MQLIDRQIIYKIIQFLSGGVKIFIKDYSDDSIILFY